ncbi:MAG TPA: NUDIX domain-containing protein [Candidatus Rhabdochlamydia sp.]|nr:NUDIX domain-containing protein [Candidatus Rhabdochlamydia sp.]
MKPFIIIVHVFKVVDGQVKCLLLRRCSKFLSGNWQMVAGKVHEGESTTVGALRELFEETGLRPDRFYTADFLESFYLEKYDIICHSPVFIAFIDQNQNVTLSPHEHDEYKWLDIPEALSLLEFSGQRAALIHIEEQFIKKKPNKIFLLDLNDYYV